MKQARPYTYRANPIFEQLDSHREIAIKINEIARAGVSSWS